LQPPPADNNRPKAKDIVEVFRDNKQVAQGIDVDFRNKR
jgi:hypothetical protein